MTAYTDDDVTAAAETLADELWPEVFVFRTPKQIAEEMLDAVAPAIAARALRQAADEAKAERIDLQERNRPEYDRTIWNLAWMERRLRARAEQVNP